jgi:rhamnulokinase
MTNVVAVDLGASSGRVMLGTVSGSTLALSELHRFRNGPVALPDGLHWDVLGLYLDVLEGLRRIGEGTQVAGIGIDGWAVDYGLLDADGALLGNPFHYRDTRTGTAIDRVHARVSPAALYARNGLQHLPFTTIFQLVADESLVRRAARLLLVPDLITYWLTGLQVSELTNASTTGLLDVLGGQWSASLLRELDLPRHLFAPLVQPGTELGGLSPAVRALTGVGDSARVLAVCSHDTASAVVGTPATDDRFAYISCGTWGLVGVELEAPVLTDAGRAANFTNERGIDGTIRYLRNVMGLWLLQESIRMWRMDLADLLPAAAALPAGGPLIDPNLPEFLAPGDMPARIRAACAASGQRVPGTPAELVRCILDSLAAAFAEGVRQASTLSGHPVDAVHMVGGGAQNRLLCQLTADACELPVLAGPVEATALGNVVTQARALGALTGDRWAARDLIHRNFTPRRYLPGAKPV